MIFSYNYFTSAEANYYCENKIIFQLNIEFFDTNYQFLYNKELIFDFLFVVSILSSYTIVIHLSLHTDL